ncbi:MAG: hypothetical protein GDA50_07315 [Alphaproteobacteria bacterium GM202ARS2]|nr:hypothetical protein [Alphaproteobacteria bacterium GM202ARS2]
MVRYSVITSAFAVLVLTACAQQSAFSPLADDALAPVDRPKPVVGETATWCIGNSDGETCDQVETKVLNIAENGCATVFEREGTQSYCPDEGPFFLPTAWDNEDFGKGRREWNAVFGELWPLKVGTRYIFLEKGEDHNNKPWVRHGELRVLGAEKMTVPAGTFDTYRITVHLGYNRSYDMNYAPELGSLVYFDRGGPREKVAGQPRFLKAIHHPQG